MKRNIGPNARDHKADKIEVEKIDLANPLPPSSIVFEDSDPMATWASCNPGRTGDIDPTDEQRSPSPEAGLRQIGAYKLLQMLGEGGMGTVWMAEQDKPVRRRVALKLIKAGIDNREVIARFEAERQALAMMDHNNIARVLDAGTTVSGQPYFVMELVHGIPFTEYCDTNTLSIDDRLELFIPVCKAVQHAHQKGIIHRDLKPSNVLVSLQDGIPVPKVIDFGLAKALQQTQKLTDKTVFTEFGQVVGTLQYMSPEQAGMNQLDVDTRTDVYSLGVMLYELLTGSTPIDRETLKQQAILGVLALIRERDPPRPSTRLSSVDEKIASISLDRSIVPSKLHKLLRGELDWVTMKALEKDRARRYETASNLADDIQRYLAGEPLLARPPSTAYRLQKLFRKHRYGLLTTAALLLFLISGLFGTGIMWRRSLREAESAYASARQAEAAREISEKQRQFATEMRKQAEVDRVLAERAKTLAENLKKIEAIARMKAEGAVKRAQLANQHAESARIEAEQAAADAKTARDEQGRLRKIAEAETVRAQLATQEKEAALVAVQEANLKLEAAFSDLKRRNEMVVYSLNLREAQSQVRAGQLPLAQRILSEVPEDRRRWEWQFLANASRLETAISELKGADPMVKDFGNEGGDYPKDVVRKLLGHTGTVYAIAFNEATRELATAGQDKIIRLWDADNWTLRKTLAGHTDAVRGLAYVPHSANLASAGFDGTVTVWDTDSGTARHTFHSDSIRFLCLCAADDGKLYAGGGIPPSENSDDNSLPKRAGYSQWRGGAVCYDTLSQKQEFEFGDHPGMVRAITVAQNQSNREQVVELPKSSNESIADKAAKRLVFTGGYDGKLVAWDARNGQQVREFLGHKSPIFGLAVNESRHELCSISGPIVVEIGLQAETPRYVGGLHLWSISDGSRLFRTKASESALYSVAVSPDGSRVITGGEDECFRIWGTATSQHLLTLSGLDSTVKSSIFVQDGQTVITGGEDGVVRVWKGFLRQKVRRFERLQAVPEALAR